MDGGSMAQSESSIIMSWYYKQMDVVYAPSQAIAEELVTFGVERGAIRVYPRGVDTTFRLKSRRRWKSRPSAR